MRISRGIFIDSISKSLGLPPRGLRSKMDFYAEHFLELRDGLIMQPHYTLQQ
jgi:hypothetical protein